MRSLRCREDMKTAERSGTGGGSGDRYSCGKGKHEVKSTRDLCEWGQRETGQGVPRNHGRLLERGLAYSEQSEKEASQQR